MKSKERHELKENELAEWFMNLPTWFEKNRNTVIYVTTSIILLAVLWYWYRYQKYVIEPKKYERFTEAIAQLPAQKPLILKANLQQTDAEICVSLQKVCRILPIRQRTQRQRRWPISSRQKLFAPIYITG